MNKRIKWVSFGLIILLLLVFTGGMSIIPLPSISSDGNLSISSQVALAAQSVTEPSDVKETPDYTGVTTVDKSQADAQQYTGITTVTAETWGYRYVLENGDIVEVGDSTTTDFLASIKTIRGNGLVDFSLWVGSGTFVPTLESNTVSFDFNSSVHVDIYPSPPCERIPEGGIEYDITLNKALAKPTVVLNADWNNVTWEKSKEVDL